MMENRGGDYIKEGETMRGLDQLPKSAERGKTPTSGI